jgi:hypothetical protein
MKRKIISFVGLFLFVGVVAFNMQMVNSNEQGQGLILENIEAIASSSVDCDLCVIESGGSTEFACHYLKDSECSESNILGSVYCNNAEECDEDEY